MAGEVVPLAKVNRQLGPEWRIGRSAEGSGSSESVARSTNLCKEKLEAMKALPPRDFALSIEVSHACDDLGQFARHTDYLTNAKRVVVSCHQCTVALSEFRATVLKLNCCADADSATESSAPMNPSVAARQWPLRR